MTAFQGSNHVLFSEPFEDANFSTRGWYDSDGGLSVDSTVFSPRQGGGAMKFHFGIGDTAPSTPKRHLFTATDTLYISFDIKLGTAATPWIGSGALIAPQLIEILTDADTSTAVPGFSFLTAYIEALQFIPLIGMSDGARTNVPLVGTDLLRSATTHAVGGSNGIPPGSNFSEFHSNGDGTYSNWAEWTYGNPGTGRGDGTSYFINDTWHRVECFLKMNSIAGGVPVGDGILRMSIDGFKVIDFTNIELRTAQYPTQKFNQFVLAPVMNSGSPIAQDLWIDNLLVADSPPDDDNGDFSSTGQGSTSFLGGPIAVGDLSITSTSTLDFIGIFTTGGEPSYCYDLILKSDVDRGETPLSTNPHLVSCLAKIPLQEGDIATDGTSDAQMTAASLAEAAWSTDGVSTVSLAATGTFGAAFTMSGLSDLQAEGFGSGTIEAEVSMVGSSDLQAVGFIVGTESGDVSVIGASDMQMVGEDATAPVPPTPEPESGVSHGDDMGGPAGRNDWRDQAKKKRKVIEKEDDELIAAIKEMARQIFDEETV